MCAFTNTLYLVRSPEVVCAQVVCIQSCLKFDDFLTDGSLDVRKLAKVRRVLAKRVDSTAESYKLAASARGYAPSGAAFPIEGLNNIVAGVRTIPGSKYVLYQGPQYVNG